MNATYRWGGPAIAAILVALAATLVLGAPPGVSAKTASKSAAHAAHGSATSEASPKALVPFAGVCDTANVTDVLGDLTDDDNKINQIALLQGRITACSHDIATALAHLPSPTPQPYWMSSVPAVPAVQTPDPQCVQPPNATPDSNRFALFETLSRCFGYLTYLNALPTPAPYDSPIPILGTRPSFYVFATGAADPVAAAVLVRSVVDRLIRAKQKAAGTPSGGDDSFDGLRIMARADWTDPASFTAQCQQDPNTRGALVIETAIPEASRLNYLLVIANFTNVSASVEMLGCGADDHNRSGVPLSLVSQQTVTGSAHQTAFVLGLLSAVAPFFIRSVSTTAVSVGGGTTNVSQKTTEAPTFSGNLLSYYQDQDLNLPAQNASVGLRVASERFADATMARLHLFCGLPELRSLADASDPALVPSPPPEHRTLPYKAASQYVADCRTFGNFALK